LAIAEGARLPEAPPEPRGHAIEVRLYAEDPAQDWRPQSGTVVHFDIPGVNSEFTVPDTYGLRSDSGIVSGSEVSTFYDPMLAKVISWAPERRSAARRLAAALHDTRLHGLTTNRGLLVNVLRHQDFLSGDTDTDFLARHGVAGLAVGADETAVRASALAAALAEASARARGVRVQRGIPAGWRNLRWQPQRTAFEVGGDRLDVDYELGRDGLVTSVLPEVALVASAPDAVTLDIDGARRVFAVSAYDTVSGRRIEVDSALGAVSLLVIPRFADPTEQVAEGAMVAPMPGTVVRLAIAAGDRVEAGTELLVLEAMKMQHRVVAATSGTVTELRVVVGQQVDAGSVLAVIEAEETA
jgi:propionyl-CoA carboxylase alpha chain